MAKQVLIESTSPFTVNPDAIKKAGGRYLVENRGGKLTVTLPMTKLNEKNLNGRTYSTGIMEGAIRKAKTFFENREMLSSVNEHPTEPYVTPGEASHVVTAAWTEDNMLYGTWEVLETHNGKNLRALIEAGVSFGVSIRGLGSVDNYGNILEDYELLGCDCVGEPSAQLRVRPQIKEESSSNGRNNNSLMKENKMAADKNTASAYLKEQKVLMENDAKGENKLAVFQRAALVESYIAESSLTGKDLVEIHNTWEKIKEGAFALVTESNAKEDKEAAGAQSTELLEKLLEKRTAQIKAMAAGLTQLSEQLKATKAVAMAATAKVASRSAIRSRVDEAAAKKTNSIVNSMLKENQELLILATQNEVKYRLAVKEAAKNATAYRLAVKEAAKLTKALAAKPAAPAAPAVKKEAAPAAPAPAAPKTKVIDNSRAPAPTKLNESRRGEVMVMHGGI